MTLPTGKEHVSFSEVKDWYDCTYRHNLKYVKKIGEFKPAIALTFGTAIHAACEDFLKTRQMKPEIAISFINEEWDRLILAGAEGFTQESREQAQIDAGLMLLEVPSFMDKNFTNWQTVSAEEYIYEPIIGHDDVKFKGFIDCIIKCDGKRKDEKLTWIIDFKTSARGWFRYKRADYLTHLQLMLYKHYWITRTSESLKDTRCAFVILKRQAKINDHIEFFPISVGEKSISKSLKVINNAVTSIKRGIAIKNRNSCKFCDYFETEHCT